MAVGHSLDAARRRAMFDQAMARVAGRFRRVEPRATARAFVLGLLTGIERKNCWRLAEQAGHARPGPMQRLLRSARWDADEVRDTLAMLALAFLAALAADTAPIRSARPNRPARGTDPIDLTVPEIRHLFGALLTPPNTSPSRVLHWSNWRRRHQAIARRCHYRRRLDAPFSP
ncbi:transposase [Kitasatospora sp. NPDC091207]|uniref:transposase n=1 Tax=Kitasatospora sp. NPDC091207 TaxID=3364083 RepID=UPI00380DD7EE